jgi:hypothetical protein
MFDGKVYVPIDKHEAALTELCGRGNRDGNVFDHNYELLTQWRSWRTACQKIDGDHRVPELGPLAEGAKKKREAALTAFEDAPAKSLESILLKLKYVDDRMYKKDEHEEFRRNVMLWRAIRDLKAAAARS